VVTFAPDERLSAIAREAERHIERALVCLEGLAPGPKADAEA
jgi:hypothetical protein